MRCRSLIDDNETTYRDAAYRGLGIYQASQLSIEKWVRAGETDGYCAAWTDIFDNFFKIQDLGLSCPLIPVEIMLVRPDNKLPGAQ
ncbi:hypothetical protein TSAR_010616 [Trichomalopsis sarcophagae]|uniref:Uncharacterized protein n=1 Tax=Trichomalopsis sarcophagae TaxID=543379 RepID=A0A232EPK4_9HYME|nr:hypothetical protein TSAR_010616 [Trichomalopsis sarcophagae]